MFFKGKNKYIFLSSIVFIFFYVFITPVPMGKDVYFMPQWITPITRYPSGTAGFAGASSDASENAAEGYESGKLMSFVSGDYFGYFSKDGTIVKSERIRERVSISDYAQAVYPEKAFSTKIYSPHGSLLTEIKAPGYVFIDEDRFFLFEPGGSSVSKYTAAEKTDGAVQPAKRQWRQVHTAPITAFHSSKSGTVIGYSDGKLSYIDSMGANTFSFYPGGSKYHVIAGAAVSDDGSKIACVCGLEKQRVLLISVTGNHYKIVHHSFLKEDLRRQVFMTFEKNSRFVVFESADGIGVIDCKKSETFFLTDNAEKTAVVNAGTEHEKNILTTLLKTANGYTLTLAEFPNFILGKTEFSSKDAFLVQKNGTVYLGLNDKIAAFAVQGLQ